MNPSALEYRRQRGLGFKDEQMALLIQRVSGSMYEDFLMPNAAGVGYSYSAYKWDDSIDASDGMLRLVMGLGTRAVDRTEGDCESLCPGTFHSYRKLGKTSVFTALRRSYGLYNKISVIQTTQRRHTIYGFLV